MPDSGAASGGSVGQARPAPRGQGSLPWHAHLLCLVVFMDLFAVSLVVPLLPYRFKELGVTPETYGVVASAYSIGNVVGGIVLGILSDNVLGRRGTLLLSMVGAATAYWMVAVATTLPMLIASRLVVGVVKQTMTCSTAIMADLTAKGPQRTKGLARISASFRLAWITGSALSAYISTFNRTMPAFIAVGIYAVAIAFVLTFLPANIGQGGAGTQDGDLTNDPLATKATATPVRPKGARALLGAVVEAFHSPAVSRVLVATFAFQVVIVSFRSTGALYLQERFGLEQSGVGWITTYTGIIGLGLQLLAVAALVRRLGAAATLNLTAWAGVVANAIEAAPIDIATYSVAVIPLKVVANSVSITCLSAMYTAAIPSSRRGVMLGAKDVLTGVAGIVAPMIGGLVLGRAGAGNQPLWAAAMYGAVSLLLLWVCPLWGSKKQECETADGGEGLDPRAGDSVASKASRPDSTTSSSESRRGDSDGHLHAD